MKSSKLSVFLFLTMAAVLLVTAGCGGAGKPQADAGSPGVSNAPTAAPTPKPEVTEEFKAEEPNTWSDSVFVVGNPKMSEITTESNALNFSLRDVETYVYRFYDKSSYDDVIVETQVTNLGDNTNGIALVCRANNEGWYEFRVASGGTYEVYMYDQKMKDRGENPYKMLESGGSGLISARSNRLKMICQGNSIKIFSNDKEIKPPKGPIEDNTLSSGKIGVGVMSFSRVPVKVSYENVAISKPK